MYMYVICVYTVGHCLLLDPKPPVCMQKSSRVYELALLCILQLYIEIWPSLLTLHCRSRNILDDFREAYFWLRQNTPDDASVMSWWDYGYQIAGTDQYCIAHVNMYPPLSPSLSYSPTLLPLFPLSSPLSPRCSSLSFQYPTLFPTNI